MLKTTTIINEMVSRLTMAVIFKQKCVRCRKNFVLISSRNRYPLCYDCQKSELNVKITNPEMKKLFDLPEEYYKENDFLRAIKANYLKFGKLSERQIEAFKKEAEKIKKTKSLNKLHKSD